MNRLSWALVSRVCITCEPASEPAAARTAIVTRNTGSRPPSATWPRNPDRDENTTASAVVPAATFGVEPEPGQPRQDDVAATDAEQAAEEPGDATHGRPDARLGHGAEVAPARPRPVEQHHRAREHEEAHEQPEQQLLVDVRRSGSPRRGPGSPPR